MARYQLILAYDGTQYAGYQRQAAEKGPTVQSEVEAALRQIGWQGSTIYAAGRTDAGVHASGQVVAFDLDWRHSPESLRAALNANLPPDIAVMEARPARPEFHPRFDAAGRRYQYRIFCQEIRAPLKERYAWRVWPAVDLERMQPAARHLMGTHDFAAFGTPPRAGRSTVRTITQAAWRPASDRDWVFEVVANAFLYRMVRRMVYVLVQIGQGLVEIEMLREMMLAPPPSPLQGLAPPQGLVLVEVLYPLPGESISRSSDEPGELTGEW